MEYVYIFCLIQVAKSDYIFKSDKVFDLILIIMAFCMTLFITENTLIKTLLILIHIPGVSASDTT